MTERLLHHHPAPATTVRVAGHAGALHLVQHDGEQARRDRQVERRVALDTVRASQFVERRGQGVERRVVVEPSWNELDVAAQAPPHCLVPGRAGVFLGRLLGQTLEVAVAPVTAREPEQHEVRWKQTTVGEVVDRGEQLLAGEVSGDAEHDQGAGFGCAGQPAVARVAKEVVRRCRLRWMHPVLRSHRSRGLRFHLHRRGRLGHELAESNCSRTLSASCA